VIKNACQVCCGKPAEERPFEKCRLKSIDIKEILKYLDMRAWTELVYLRISNWSKLLGRQVWFSGSIKCTEFDQLKMFHSLKKDCVAWS
jgi:hypothetical protein